ncbi:MAG: HlyD family type I secretion periplasmic adaptor subunit [Pseudomonadota bacterium]
MVGSNDNKGKELALAALGGAKGTALAKPRQGRDAQMSSGVPQADDKRWAASGYIRWGLFVVLLLGGGLGTWSAIAKLSGAVIASGQLRVESQRQIVQHPDGGVVGEILARDGDLVEAGQVLIELDGTALGSELAALESQLYEIMARRARLAVEQVEGDEIVFPQELLDVAEKNPDVAALVEGQRQLFAARAETLSRELEVLGERTTQTSEQIVGADREAEAYGQQIELIEEELVAMEGLMAQGLVQMNRVLSLKRERARLQGERNQLLARVAQLEGQKSEIEIERLRLVSSQREEAATQLSELGYRELELKERRISLIDQLARLEIRAPRAGVVYDSIVHALKSVVRPAEPLMYIVPSDAKLVIDAQVQPINVDEVWTGQEAVLRFSAFNTRTTPDLYGAVLQVSPDAFQNEDTGESFYRTEVVLKEGEIQKLKGQELKPGMPVEVFIQTGERTPIDYLMRPMTDFFDRALRED